MKYMVEHSCGHCVEHELFGPTRDRERKIEWMATIPCPECREKEAKEAAMAFAAERGLPELTGTQKQVDWALSLRNDMVDLMETEVKHLTAGVAKWDEILKDLALKAEEDPSVSEKLERKKELLEKHREQLKATEEALEAIYGVREAHWWIEHRSTSVSAIIAATKELAGQKKEAEIVAEAVSKMVIMEPEKKETGTVAVVLVDRERIAVTSEKDDVIRTTLKANGFSWDGGARAWTKAICEMTGEAKDLLPDTARILLEAGVPVKASREVKEAVESGSYEPECHRWIKVSSRDSKKLYIFKANGVSFPSGSKTTWEGGALISPTRWKEIREFAELNGYRITKRANELLSKAEAATVAVKPAAKTDEQVDAKEKLQAILESSRDILDDLKDED